MHILLISDNYPPETNAPASRGSEHAQHWVRLGHKVSVLTCAPNFPYGKVYDGYRNSLFQHQNIEGVDVYRVWTFMSPNAGTIRRSLDFGSFMISSLLGSFRVNKPDIVIATSPQLFSGISGYLVSKLKRRPFIFEVRDLWPEQIFEIGFLKEGRIHHLLKRIAKYLYINSDLIVTVGEGYKEQIINGYSISSDHIQLIPNGVVLDNFTSKGCRQAIRKRLGLKNKFVVAYIGTHGMSQKLETILDAAEITNNEDVSFVFFGDGARKKYLLEEKARRKLENCSFYPAVQKEEVPALYEAADLCVVTLKKCDLFKGTCPSKIFEAMAMECPIVLSGEGRSEAILEEAKAGISVPPEKPDHLLRTIINLSKDQALRINMGKNGRKYVEAYHSREKLAEQYIKVLEKIMNPIETSHSSTQSKEY